MGAETPAQSPQPLPTTVTAALLVFARNVLVELQLPHPAVSDILTATEVSKARAYELSKRLPGLLTRLVGPNGRPKKDTPPPLYDSRLSLAQAMLTYVMAHPGCVSGSTRRRYSDGFRGFVVQLRQQYPGSELSTFATTIGLSVHTVEDWLRPEASAPFPEIEDTPSSSSQTQEQTETETVEVPRVASILNAWKTWQGNLSSFCKHVSKHLRIPYGIGRIRNILEQYGERIPQRRSGRCPSEEAIRDQHKLFFPGAQWQGDGMQLPIVINGERFDFNFELMVDTASGAWVGMSLRDEEDSQAVIEAMQDGAHNSEHTPIAITLDNRPSNHTDEVCETIDGFPAFLIPATKGRGQSKAHVEGAFGLLSQHTPPLEIYAANAREFAREVLQLILQVSGRILNHRPRTDRKDKKSRAGLLNESQPSKDDIAKAKAELKEIQRRQEQKLKNQEARSDPLVRQIIEEALQRLGLEDPKHHFRNAIALFGRDAVADGIATFEGKAKNGTLPPGVDARYLLGIVKNIYNNQEAEAITEALIEQRMDMNDRQLRQLEETKITIINGLDGFHESAKNCVLLLAESERRIDQLFWGCSLGELILQQPHDEQPSCFRYVAHLIRASFQIPSRTRMKHVHHIARIVWPVS